MVPIEQRDIDFQGTTLSAVRDRDGIIWVPLRRLCEAIGLNYAGQYTKAKEDRVLSRHIAMIEIPDSYERLQETVCLDLAFVRGWLFGINANKVKADVREVLERYQEHVYEVINRAFEATSAVQDTVLSDEMIRAVLENLDHQKHLWTTVLQEKRRLRAVEGWVQDVDDRMGDLDRTVQQHDSLLRQTLEDLQQLRHAQQTLTTQVSERLTLLPALPNTIDASQKAALKALVDDIVAAAGERGIRVGQGRNDYPAVWDAFKRRFDLAKYDELPASQFGEAMKWLKAWKDRLG